MMKKALFITIAFLSVCLASAEQITTPKLVLACDGYATLDISLSNTRTDLVAFQMDMQLPEGVSIDKTGCSLSSRITDVEQKLTIGRLESGVYRLASTSMSLKPFCGNDSTLLTLRLTTSDTFVCGDAMISNILFSTSNSEGIEMDDVSFSMNTLYRFTYKVDGEEYKTASVAYGTELTAETAPTKEGYTFSGWSEIPATMPAHDVEVTGNFAVNNYMLIYKVDGEEYKTASVAYGTALTVETAPSKEGYTFSGWSEIPVTMPAHDVEVTGSFVVNSYMLTYKVDGEEYKTTSVAYGTELTAETAPTREGYTFSGWSEIPATMPAHDVEVSGTFSVNSYTVTFKYGDEVLTTASVDYGAEIPLPESLGSERYTLVEWKNVPETMPAYNITIFAIYTDGVSAVQDDNPDAEYYQLNGMKRNNLKRGINIIRTSDGTTRKVVVK